MNIAFIGLGTMGSHMARSLRKAGHSLIVHDLRPASAEPHISEGAAWASTPAEAARQADVVFTSLPGPAEVEAVALGDHGILAALRPGGAYFDLSTNSPSVVRRIHAAFAERGAHMLDAPVSGGPAGAESRKLALWVGGDRAIFDAHHALLSAIGDQARYVGSIGSGTVAKLVHNCAGYVINTALAEAFALGVKAGVDPFDLWDAVRQGMLGRRSVLELMAIQFLPGKFDPPAFALKLAHKDVGLAVALGRELRVPMRLANLTYEEMTEALNRGWGDRDSRVAMTLELERAGVKIAVDPARLQAAMEKPAGQ